MKSKTIVDKTFRTYIKFVWDCSEKEFVDWWNKKSEYKIEYYGDSDGKFAIDPNKTKIVIWIKNTNDVEALSHEILHAVNFWLNEYFRIYLTKETDEIYAMLHSFYMREVLKLFGLKKFSGYKN